MAPNVQCLQLLLACVQAAAEFATATYVGDAESCDEVPALNGDTTHTAGAANGGASDAADAAKDAVSPGGTATPARQRTSDRITRTLTGGLRPAFAAAQWGPDRAAGPQGDTAKLVSLPPGSGGALVSSTGGAANGNGSQSTQPQEGQGVQQPAAATQGPSSRATLTEGTAEESVVVQPAEAPRPSDVAEELARMAREVRMQVKDVTIRIDTVLGTGAFGVVYGGEGVLNCCIMYTALCAWQRRWPCTYATMCVLHSPKDASLGAFRIRPRSGTRCVYRHLAGHSRGGKDGDYLGVTRATQARAS